MHHTYLNSSAYGGADLTAEIPDMDFVTDANVYYNLPPPPPPPSSYSRSALSLPRGHLAGHHHNSCPSSSCPSSPKLPPTGGNRKGKSPGTRNHRHHVGEKAAAGSRGHLSAPRTRGSNSLTATERGSLPTAVSAAAAAVVTIPADTASPPTTALPPPPVKDRLPPTKTKKLSHTRSFDLDHIYQNLVRVATKPRSNSFSVPWRRKKKNDSPVAMTGEILEEATSTVCQTYSSSEVVPDLSRLEGAVGRAGGSQGEGSPNSLPGSRSSKTTSRSSSSSSSSTSTSSGSDSETGSESAFDDPALISPGITYLRDGTTPRHSRSYPLEVLNACYHSTATLPLRNSSKGVLNPVESKASDNNIYANAKPEAVRCTSSIISQVCHTFDVAASLDEWRRKEKWLEKKRSSRNLRQSGESGEVHIVILYAQDGADWKNYLCELFTQMVPKEEGCQAVRVEVKNVEEIEDTVGGLEAVRLKEARLQIVIISPRFMAHIAGHGRSEIGQLFEPEKVLGLLLGVNDSQFSMAHLSALYSYKDWHRLKVRNSDLHFVEEVLCEAIKILNKNKLYVDFLDERAAKFKVSSRKITMTQKQLYIILNDEVAKSDSLQIFIEVPGRNPVPIQKYHLLNPYTVWFTMPEEFLKTSSILQINILVNGVDLGSRQLKCESHMDTLRDILACVANPTEFMCQALNINPICEDLDQKLAEKVKHRMPLTKIEEPSIQREVGEFPTWIHFSAYYGLDRLTWALLEVPGAEEALTTSNCYGHTPSILAYKKGFYSLAQKLEDVVLVSSLAVKACNIPRVYNNICVLKDSISPQEMYNCPPPPRPLATVSSSTKLPNYDTLPAPRVVTSCSSTPGGITPPDSVNTSPVPKVACNECQLATDSQNLTSTPVTDRASSTTASPVPVRHKTQAEKPLDCYVDMNVSSDRHGKLFEYREDVNTLIGAWNEKTNIKTFVERNQNEIDKMKCRLEAAHEELHSEMCAKIRNDEVLPSVPVDNDKFPSDGQQHKNIVEKFITLLQDSPTNSENNFCEVNNTPVQCPCNGIKDTSSPPADFLKNKGSSQSCVLRDRPPVPMPRHESEIYLTADQLHTPKQYQILIAKKQFEEEEEEEKRKKLGKSSSYSNVPRTALVGKFPRSASGSSKKFSGTSPPKRTEENGIKEEVFYTKLLKD